MKITKMEVQFEDSGKFNLTHDGICPNYTGSTYPVDELQATVDIWKAYFATRAPRTLPTPATVNAADRSMYLNSVMQFTETLSDLTTADSTVNIVPILSGLLYDVATLLAIEEKLAADRA
jgi:hypothetical protein